MTDKDFLALENRCSDLEMELTRAQGMVAALKVEVGRLREQCAVIAETYFKSGEALHAGRRIAKKIRALDTHTESK